MITGSQGFPSDEGYPRARRVQGRGQVRAGRRAVRAGRWAVRAGRRAVRAGRRAVRAGRRVDEGRAPGR